MTRRFFALAAALPLLLAGCGGDDDPQPKMPETQAASATPTPSASPTGPVEPTPPPETEGAGDDAAIAFVEHYFAMVTYAQSTGDTSGLDRLALEACIPCKGGLKYIRSTYDKGGYIEGGALSVKSASARGVPLGSKNPEIFSVDAKVQHADENRYPTSSAEPRNFPAGASDWQVYVVDNGDGWRVSDWDILS